MCPPMNPVAPKTRTFKVCVSPIASRGLASDQEEPRGHRHEQADEAEADQHDANPGRNLGSLTVHRKWHLSRSRDSAKQATENGWAGHEHDEDHGDDDTSLSSHFFPPFKQRVCSPTHAGAVARLDSGLPHGVAPLARRIVAQERQWVRRDDLPRHLYETFEW